MTGSKLWYQSKVFWLGVITTLLGIIPIVTELASQTAVTPAALGTAATGILIVIVRVWFTDQPTTKPFGIGEKDNGPKASNPTA